MAGDYGNSVPQYGKGFFSGVDTGSSGFDEGVGHQTASDENK